MLFAADDQDEASNTALGLCKKAQTIQLRIGSARFTSG